MKLVAVLLPTLAGLMLSGWQLTRLVTPAPVVRVGMTTVRIEHEWQQSEGDKLLRYRVPSLGTVIGQGLIVSHDHFHPSIGHLDREAWYFTGETGATVRVEAAGVTRRLPGAEVSVLVLPVTTGAPAGPTAVAAETTIAALKPGDRLTVAFWEDAAGQFAQADLAVVAVAPSVITLADPGHLLNGGDSGGGVYYRGELVGNTWGLLVDQDHAALGLVTVALLPPTIAAP